MKGYDNVPENEDILLDLPFYEGTGSITRDQAKPHHQDVTLIGTPLWRGVFTDGDLVTNGGFLLYTNDAGELTAGNLTVGKCYKISFRTTEDFTADGACDNEIGTYFIATNNTVTLDLNNRVFPVTLDNWDGYEPSVESIFGYLTYKAYKAPSVASNLEQPTVVPVAGKVYEVVWTLTKIAGDAGDGITVELGSTDGTLRTTSGKYLDRIIATDTDFLKFKQTDADADLEVTIDNISCGVPSLGAIEFSGGAQYIELDKAACVDLAFIAGDYSLGLWFNWIDNSTSQILMGRYELNVGGWELYLYGAGGPNYVNLRHSHAATLVPAGTGNPRSGCYSTGWTPDTWWFMGLSRIGGGEAQFYRNGTAVVTTTGGLVDPETCNRDLVIGARYSKDTNYYKGQMWCPRIWNRALSASEWQIIFETERAWFGV